MSIDVYLDQKRPVSLKDTGVVGVTVTDNDGFTNIVTVSARGGYDAKIGIGLDVAPGTPAAAVQFRVLVNGNVWTDDLYNQVNSQPTATNDVQGIRNNMRDIPEGALIQVQGQLTSAGGNFLLYARAIIEYRPKN